MKIRIILLAMLMLSALQQAWAQTQTAISTNIFTLRGRLTNTHRDSVLIYYENNEGKSLFQSRPISSDRFIVTDSLTRPVSAIILFKDQGETLTDSAFDARSREFYIEPGRLYLSGDPSRPDSLKLIGSKSQDEYVMLTKSTAATRAEMKPITDRYNKEKDPERAAQIGMQFAPYDDRVKAITYQFFLNHPGSYVTAHEMISYVSLLGLDSSKYVYSSFPEEIKQSPDGQRLAAAIQKLDAVQPGNVAPDFMVKDISGNAVSLTECRGNYILLDFWASWNRNSRQSNAHVQEVYNKYRSKGLIVIGVADNDSSPQAWKNAIAKDKLGEWVNILSGAGTDNDINDKYAVHFVPTKLLIDPSGKIIGRFGDTNNTHADVLLDRQLAAIFKQ